MSDNRNQPRKIATEAFEIFDNNSDELLGQLVNLTTEGLMLISSRPLAAQSIFQLEMRFSKTTQGKEKICFGTETLWCAKANQAGHYWAGLHIIDISDETIDFIEQMIFNWHDEQLANAS